MCGRRKIDGDFPKIAANYGDMDFELVKKIANQIPTKKEILGNEIPRKRYTTSYCRIFRFPYFIDH